MSVAIFVQFWSCLAEAFVYLWLMEPEEKAGRGRWAGDAYDLHKVFESLVPVAGLAYGTKTDCSTEPKVLLKHRAMLVRLKKMQDNMCFKVADLRKALSSHPAVLKMSKDEKRTWVYENAERLSCMCTHTMRAWRRHKPPAWVLEVLTDKKSVVTQLQAS